MIHSQKWLPLALAISVGTAMLIGVDARAEEREIRKEKRHDVRDEKREHQKERREVRDDKRERQKVKREVRDDKRERQKVKREVRDDKRERQKVKREVRDERREQRIERYETRDKKQKHRIQQQRVKPHVIYRGPGRVIPPKRIRHYRNIVVVRPYGHWYSGYAHFHLDHDAFKWLAFTAITLAILDNLNEAQQRAHEAAQVEATTAPVGEKIIWEEGNASGSVTTTREGTSTAGRYCREFVQEATIGGKVEQVYGTACRNPDDSWEVISTENP